MNNSTGTVVGGEALPDIQNVAGTLNIETPAVTTPTTLELPLLSGSMTKFGETPHPSELTQGQKDMYTAARWAGAGASQAGLAQTNKQVELPTATQIPLSAYKGATDLTTGVLTQAQKDMYTAARWAGVGATQAALAAKATTPFTPPTPETPGLTIPPIKLSTGLTLSTPPPAMDYGSKIRNLEKRGIY
jgi:hypothetical protein